MTKYKFILFSIILIFLSKYSFGQNDSCKIDFNKCYIKSYLTNTKNIIISPIKWNNKEIIAASGIIIGTGLLMTQDLNIKKFSQEIRTEKTDLITKHGLEPFGSGVYSMPAMALLVAHGKIFKNERTTRVGLNGIQAYILSGIFVNIPKYLFNRHRPYHDDPSYQFNFDGPFTGNYYKSFVSGHTTSIFSVATIVASEYKDKPLIPILCYTIATASGLSRIHDNKHWASDVLGGAAFGFAIGKLIHNANNKKLKYCPVFSHNQKGITFVYYLN